MQQADKYLAFYVGGDGVERHAGNVLTATEVKARTETAFKRDPHLGPMTEFRYYKLVPVVVKAYTTIIIEEKK